MLNYYLVLFFGVFIDLAVATPPACLLACVSSQVKSDGSLTFTEQDKICSYLGSQIIFCLTQTCPNNPNNDKDSASSYFSDLCGSNLSTTTSPSSSSPSSSSSSSTIDSFISSSSSTTSSSSSSTDSSAAYNISVTTSSEEYNNSSDSTSESYSLSTILPATISSSSLMLSIADSSSQTVSTNSKNNGLQMANSSVLGIFLSFFFSLIP